MDQLTLNLNHLTRISRTWLPKDLKSLRLSRNVCVVSRALDWNPEVPRFRVTGGISSFICWNCVPSLVLSWCNYWKTRLKPEFNLKKKMTFDLTELVHSCAYKNILLAAFNVVTFLESNQSCSDTIYNLTGNGWLIGKIMHIFLFQLESSLTTCKIISGRAGLYIYLKDLHCTSWLWKHISHVKKNSL